MPGLATGADRLEDLIEKLKIVIPELLVENGLLPTGNWANYTLKQAGLTKAF